MFLDGFNFLHFLMYCRVLTFISVINCWDTLFCLQCAGRRSTSANTSFGLKRSRTKFFVPNESVSSTYWGGAESKLCRTTVFPTLNRGRFCSSDSCASYLLCVRFCSCLVVCLAARTNTTTDGISFSGNTARRSPILSVSWSSSVRLWVLALLSSFVSNLSWKSLTLFSSKQPLLGILNLRKRGILSECLHFVKKLMIVPFVLARYLLIPSHSARRWYGNNMLITGRIRKEGNQHKMNTSIGSTDKAFRFIHVHIIF